MLNELTLYGEIDRVQTAVDRIASFADLAAENNENGYALMDSGGKDSDVIKAVAFMAHRQRGIRFEIIHSHTTADHPLTVRYVRKEMEYWSAKGIPYSIVYPTFKGHRTSMWQMIEHKGCPTRIHRWCCEYLKERTAGEGRFVITGVRWAESSRRKNTRATYEIPNGRQKRIILNNDNDARRKMTEICMTRGQFVLNPIIDWSDSDVWEFHRRYGLSHNPLYDSGNRRVGCVGCPMGNNKDELEAMPEYKKLYIHAFDRFLQRRSDLVGKNGWNDGKSMYQWWVSGAAASRDLEEQASLFADDSGEDI